jgi:hypothetical protein
MEMHMESQTAESHVLLVQRWLLGGWTAQVLRTAALLGLADHLSSGVKSLDEIAVATGTEPGAMARFLRACVLLGLCTDRGGHFELAPAGDALRSDVPGSLRPAVLMLTAPWVQHAWETLPEAVRTGRPTFATAHGTDFWSYLAGHPRDQADFDQAMAAGSSERARAVLATCTFDELETIVDVGGGTGRFLAELLAALPNIRGILADRAEVVAGAGTVLAEAGVADRCEVVPTDFFDSVVSGGDAYVLAQILHDWPDEKCVEILRKCADAMEYGARLWVIEQVVQDDLASTSLGVALLDLNMLICFGARERTGDEYVHLLETTGFTNVTVRDTGTAWRVIEGQRADSRAVNDLR